MGPIPADLLWIMVRHIIGESFRVDLIVYFYAIYVITSFIIPCYGLKGDTDTVFGIRLDTGKVVFSNKGHCDNGCG